MAEEELLKADSKGDNQEAELLILDEFAVLCRDLYAFYPMLIRYVDNNRYNIRDWILFQDFWGVTLVSSSMNIFPELYPPIFQIYYFIPFQVQVAEGAGCRLH